jgi:hypothetical protein
MGEAVRWLREQRGWTRAAIVTDSKSLAEAIQGEPGTRKVAELQEGLWSLHERGGEVDIVWAPGHCGLPGNERADEMARLGSEMEQQEVEVDGATRAAVIRRTIGSARAIAHDRLAEVYRAPIRRVEEEMDRGKRTMLARFRTG